MNVSVKCFATLAEADRCDYRESRSFELPADADMKTLIKKLDIPEEKVELIFVNGKRAASGVKLSEGDQVGIFPAVGGM